MVIVDINGQQMELEVSLFGYLGYRGQSWDYLLGLGKYDYQ